jgi:hypothetical protein
MRDATTMIVYACELGKTNLCTFPLSHRAHN